MTGLAACLPRWRWWAALPLMVPVYLSIRLCDWSGRVLHRVAARIWSWAFA